MLGICSAIKSSRSCSDPFTLLHCRVKQVIYTSMTTISCQKTKCVAVLYLCNCQSSRFAAISAHTGPQYDPQLYKRSVTPHHFRLTPSALNICKAQSAKLPRNLEVLRLSIEGNKHNWMLREILRLPAAHPSLQKIAQLYVHSVLLKSLHPFFMCTKCFLHTLLASNTWIIGATVYGIIINQLPDYPEHLLTLDLLCLQEGYNILYDYLLV
jgi:hypothetical protein